MSDNKGSVFYRIPGNIKQQCLPFVLNPNNPLHSNFRASEEIAGAYPQLFTFRKNTNGTPDGGRGIINFIPNSFNDYMEEDISYKLLYSGAKKYSSNYMYSDTQAGVRIEKLTANEIFSALPGIQIREFLPETQLDYNIQLFTKMFSDVQSLFTDTNLQTEEGVQQAIDNAESITWQDVKKFGLQLWRTSKYLFRYITGQTAPNTPDFLTDFQTEFSESLDGKNYFENYKKDFTTGKDQPGFKILTIPYLLYYKLQTSVTTNIYEIPNQITNHTVLDSSTGMAGWMDDPGGMRFNGLFTKVPVIGNFLASITQNIGINYMPWWTPSTGTATKYPEIEVTFNLFNDTVDSALMNFIFVNTIIPNNMWIQYGMFQHSSNLYDIKIEGLNRLYACAGAFRVEYLGNLRTPSATFMEKLVKSHTNKNCDAKGNMDNSITHDQYSLIRIPDVYKVILKFQSLLPANFNNYLYIFSKNSNITLEHIGSDIFSKNEIDGHMDNFSTTVMDRLSKVWKAAESKSENVDLDQEAGSTVDNIGNMGSTDYRRNSNSGGIQS